MKSFFHLLLSSWVSTSVFASEPTFWDSSPHWNSQSTPEFQSLGLGQDLGNIGTGILSKKTKTSSQSAPSTVKVLPADLPNLVPDGSMSDFRLAVDRQLARCAQLNARDVWYVDGRILSRKQWCTETGKAIIGILNRSADWATYYQIAKTELEWYKSIGRDQKGEVLYTGYYLPTLKAKRVADATFKYPLYSHPADLVQTTVSGKLVWRRKLPDGKLVPYYKRSEIDGDGQKPGALAGQGLEILYTDDLFANFILQIQGSGIAEVTEKDGTRRTVSINYAAQNGHPYTSIGSYLKSQGVDPSYLTLQGMRRYFALYPGQLIQVLNVNESYVFFQESPVGPYGAAGTVIVPWHSIAVDLSQFPTGAYSMVQTQRPMKVVGDQGTDWQPFLRMTVNQDTGGAIRGPGRVDIYWGGDAYAEIVAGQTAHTGSLYFAAAPETKKKP
ncbi:MAG: MltA domain-containing protein [Bdellovibrionales bacterium]|nr:MltA domain-containing protein [Bdellovibrionales bacterium]